MNCPICNGSGERDGEYGLLSCDAPNCTAATERAALEAANKAAEPMTVYDQRWFSYGLGKENALRFMPEAKHEVVGRGALNEFTEKYCLGKLELSATAESAFYWFNKVASSNRDKIPDMDDDKLREFFNDRDFWPQNLTRHKQALFFNAVRELLSSVKDSK